jgi:hypothetical protein
MLDGRTSRMGSTQVCSSRAHGSAPFLLSKRQTVKAKTPDLLTDLDGVIIQRNVKHATNHPQSSTPIVQIRSETALVAASLRRAKDQQRRGFKRSAQPTSPGWREGQECETLPATVARCDRCRRVKTLKKY